jgi:hypothetical protein
VKGQTNGRTEVELHRLTDFKYNMPNKKVQKADKNFVFLVKNIFFQSNTFKLKEF